MRRYIVFQADKNEKTEWRERKLQHTQALTWILAEYWDSSDKPIPEPGYRPTEFIKVDALHNPDEHAYSTHYRKGDWEVDRVETYTPDITVGTTFGMIVICYCKYKPINAPLTPMPDRQVSLESFGGDKTKYEEWQKSQKVAVEA